MRALINNPLFRIVGVVVILYFALFKNNHEVDSLSNRLKPAKVKSDLADASANTIYIIDNIQKARSMQGTGVKIETPPLTSNLIITDIKIGKNARANCNDQINFNYEISLADNKILQKNKANLVIGDGQFPLEIENHIIGMKQGGVRIINVPVNYKSADKNLSDLLSENNQDITYKITLLEITKSPQHNFCK